MNIPLSQLKQFLLCEQLYYLSEEKARSALIFSININIYNLPIFAVDFKLC